MGGFSGGPLFVNNQLVGLLTHYYDEMGVSVAVSSQKILNFIDEPEAKTPFISKDEVVLNTNHSVWGNPSRFNKGNVTIKPDMEWTNKLSKADKLISTFVTLPLLSKYGCKIFV